MSVSYVSALRGLADMHLLETPNEELLRDVTGLELEASGHALLDKGAGIRSTQRLALGEVEGSIVVFTWPAELKPQANYLYRADRGERLLRAATDGGWEVDIRPHLAFWLSSPPERLHMNSTLSPEEYVAAWSGPDRDQIGEHDPNTIRLELWPWLVEHGYATQGDESMLDSYLARLRSKKRRAHLRPGLRLLRRWNRDEVRTLREQSRLARIFAKK